MHSTGTLFQANAVSLLCYCSFPLWLGFTRYESFTACLWVICFPIIAQRVKGLANFGVLTGGMFVATGIQVGAYWLVSKIYMVLT